MSEIFNSYFTLKYNNKEIEQAYQVLLNKKLKVKNITYTVITLSIVIMLNILFSVVNDKRLYALMIISFILTGMLTIILAICITNTNKTVLKIISYIIFYLLMYSDVLVRGVFLNLGVDVVVLCLVYTIQYLYILTWYYTCTIDFLPGCLLTVIKMVSYIVVFAPIGTPGHQFRFSINEILALIVCLFSYFYVYEKRKSFYYFKNAEISQKWSHNILENMNTGFLSVTNDGTINYINKSLLSYLNGLANTEQQNLQTESNSCYGEASSFKLNLLEYLFKEQQFANLESTESQNAFERTKYFLKYNSLNKFVLIGTNSLKIENANLHFEVFGRYYVYNNQDLDIETFEFIFNDITRVKSNEEVNAEFKFKSMFLAKVAHEFKNPILCITELADQIAEKIEPLISNSDSTTKLKKLDSFDIKEILSNIKSMSDYLLILIKDMDFFSIKNSTLKKNIKVEKEYINMNNLVNFLKGVTYILIKKFNKENNIKFSIDYGALPKEIYTDEIKLKQILINLLSNAVKYTMSGSINLTLEYEDNRLIFIVKDTGKGIRDSQKAFLFNAYMMEQNRDYNHIGAGLGLSIVKDLVELLGSEIKYEPNVPEGSKFIFAIEIIKRSLMSSKMSLDNNVNNSIVIGGVGSQGETIVVDFYPVVNNLKDSLISDNVTKNAELSSISVVDYLPYQHNILIVDDEVITRKSTIRLIENFCKSCSIKVNFIEADDGIECLYNYYRCIKNGEKVSLIICDQYMTFMNGTSCAKVIQEITKSKSLLHMPFYLVTAFESFANENDSGIDNIYTKPLMKKNLEDIFLKSNII
jgi:signal transduction histidine kinase/CheY-like chemotaxis protein